MNSPFYYNLTDTMRTNPMGLGLQNSLLSLLDPHNIAPGIA
jgi:hypothetical protein